jgi:hypothetical protein
MQRKASVLVYCVVFMAASASVLAQTPGTIAKFSDSGELDDSVIVQNGGNIGIGTTPDPAATLSVNNGGAIAIQGVGGAGGQALYGVNSADFAEGVRGDSATGAGVVGTSNGTFNTGAAFGVIGISTDSVGTRGSSTNSIGVRATSVNGQGLVASSGNGDHIAAGRGVGSITFRVDNNGEVYTPAVHTGGLDVSGTLSKSAGQFKIDHPLDPANKYLSHSFVESPDMKNIYDGTVTTDARGYATVALPQYFEALNSDFRYQLTAIGQFAQAIVASEIKNNRFTIRTSSGNVKVSWQVTGIRKDAYANAHRIKVEEDKALAERNRYLHPEVFGQPREKAIGRTRPLEMTTASK